MYQSALRFIQAQVDGVQFPAETVETEAEPDALVVDGEIARAGKEGVARLGPIDFPARTVHAGNRRERAGVLDRRGIGDDREEAFRSDLSVDQLVERALFG